MRKWLLRCIPICLVLGFVGMALAQTYTCTVTAVSSSSSPVAIMTPGRMTTWQIRVHASPAADPILYGFYSGTTVPTAVPSPEADMELASGDKDTDSVDCDVGQCGQAIGEGIWAVLESGSTATKVHVCTR